MTCILVFFFHSCTRDRNDVKQREQHVQHVAKALDCQMKLKKKKLKYDRIEATTLEPGLDMTFFVMIWLLE